MPGRKRSFFTGPRKPFPVRRTPIRIPQDPTRPIKLHRKTLFRTDLAHPQPWFFVIHHRGPRRVMVGQDPNEARAVPKEKVRGTLPERIIYQWLTDRKEQFTFQTSMLGGRQELGGLVADFILTFRMVILNPTGPTHDVFIQKRKDDEQRMTLEQMGYRVYFIPEADVLDEYKLDRVMRAILDLGVPSASVFTEETPGEDFTLERLYGRLQTVQASLQALKDMLHG